jgi:hypothetical protein
MMLRRQRKRFRLQFMRNTASGCDRRCKGRHPQRVNREATSQTEWPRIICVYFLHVLIMIAEAAILVPLEVFLQKIVSCSKSRRSTSQLGYSRWTNQERTMYRMRSDWTERSGGPPSWRRRSVMWPDDVMWPGQLRCIYPERQLSNVCEDCFYFRRAISDSLIVESNLWLLRLLLKMDHLFRLRILHLRLHSQ